MDAGYGGGKLGGASAADVGDAPAAAGAAAVAPVAAAAAAAVAADAAPAAEAGEAAAVPVAAPDRASADGSAAADSPPVRPLLCGTVPAPAVVVVVVAAAAGGSPVPEKSALRGTVGLGAVTATGAGVVANTTEPPSEPCVGETNRNRRKHIRMGRAALLMCKGAALVSYAIICGELYVII